MDSEIFVVAISMCAVVKSILRKGVSMVRGIWSTDSVTDSRAGTDEKRARPCPRRAEPLGLSTSTGEGKQCENLLTPLEILLALC